VGRYIGGHTHRDTGGAIHQQGRHPGGQYLGYLLGSIVVIDKVHCLLVEVRKHIVGYFSHANFGIAHGSRRVTIDRTKVALAIYQHIAHGKRLGHTHYCVVNRRVAVGVVFTDDIADNPGRLFVGLVPVVVQLIHREQYPPVHRLEAVPNIRQCPADDDAHGVIEIGLLQFVLNVYGNNFFRYFTHVLRFP